MKEEFQDFLRELADTLEEEYQSLYGEGAHKKDISDKSEVVTEVDRRMTDLIKSEFRQRNEKFSFASEEMDSGEGERNPDYTVIFDEIDGTGNMKNSRGPFGPVIGVAEGENPRFQDVLACIFYDFRNGVLYEAYEGEGAFMSGEGIESGSQTSLVREETSIMLDQVMLARKPEMAKLWKYYPKDYASTAFHISLVSSGRAEVFITGSHGYLKEGNTAEEIGPLYLLVNEAGGAVLNWEGEKIADERIGMYTRSDHDYVAAATEELARKTVEEIKIASSEAGCLRN